MYLFNSLLFSKNHEPKGKVKTFKSKIAYGYIWVCLDDNPRIEIPFIDEAFQESYSLVHEFHEIWQVNPFRVMENELDMAHPSFVHTATFGDQGSLIPDYLQVWEVENGIEVKAQLGVKNCQAQTKQTNISETTRLITAKWYMPLVCKLRIDYPNGISHIIVNMHTPINDKQSLMNQFILRNDLTNFKSVIDLDRKITLEDKYVLEACHNFDFPLDIKEEEHMYTDRPGILIRKKLRQLMEGQ